MSDVPKCTFYANTNTLDYTGIIYGSVFSSVYNIKADLWL